MVIGVCGYGYSGSGAILDMLREMDSCCCLFPDQEFLLPYTPGGIQDLEYQLMERKTRYLASDAAIKRFLRLVRSMESPRSMYRKSAPGKLPTLSKEFISKITQVTWQGTYYNDTWQHDLPNQFVIRVRNRVIELYEKIFDTQKRIKGKMYLSVAPKGFYAAAHDYIHQVITDLGYDWNKHILLNQPFDVYAPKQSMKYFDNPFAIIVDRDPRDIYVLAKKYLKREGSFIPSDKVEDYILYHRLIRTKCEEEDGSDILRISFEDMVYDYDETALKIRSFLGLSDSQQEKKKYFDPDVSIENTQLFVKHPELAEDIHKIEKALPEYLYPFEKYARKPKHKVDAF